MRTFSTNLLRRPPPSRSSPPKPVDSLVTLPLTGAVNPRIASKNVLITETITPPSSAATNPSTCSTDGKIKPSSQSRNPLTTRMKSPIVAMTKRAVKKSTSGRIKAVTSAKPIANRVKTPHWSLTISMPGNSHAATQIANA